MEKEKINLSRLARMELDNKSLVVFQNEKGIYLFDMFTKKKLTFECNMEYFHVCLELLKFQKEQNS